MSSIVRTSLRGLKRSYSTKVWSDFKARPETLRLIDSKFQKGIFEGIDEATGPSSYTQIERRSTYNSPVAIDETFKLSYQLLEEEASKIYAKIDKLKAADPEKHSQQIEKLLVKAEQYNPEVIFNIENFPENIDRDQPVYRKYLKEVWESHDLMLTMQRLEQLHVIPDTLPTLDPKAEVKVKFPHNTTAEFGEWIEPGTILPTFAVNKPPTIHIQEFEAVPENSLYTVLLVNPDTPDVSTNSFKTTLHYALTNVPLSNSNNIIDSAKIFNDGDKYVIHEYEPLVPEKNAQTQRACLWVFRQGEGEISASIKDKESFDIRDFAASNNLTAVGAHVWRQHFDRSTNKVREEYGLPEGRVFHRVRKPHPVSLSEINNVE